MASRCFGWIFLVALWSSIRGQPVCVEINSILNCKVNANADFVDLSSVAENIRLSFKQGHQVTFEDSLFPRLPALKTLTVDLHHVQTLSSGRVFQHLDALQNLYFENKDPYRPLPDLNLTSNTLKGLTTLKVLSFQETGLVQIQTDALQDLTNLTEFTLSRNQVPSLPDDIFATTKLQTLTLEHLGQFRISQATFQGLDLLQTLTLTDNMLNNLESGIFSGSPNLEVLSLENNQLVTLSANAFRGLSKLTRLTLSGNNLTTIEAPVFDSVTSLNHLDLTGCNIESIADGAFASLGSLTYLKVANNRIGVLTPDTLRGLTQLQFFEAERNQIQSVGPNAFSDSPSMIIVHLYNNEISKIHPEAFKGADTSVLTLHDNQLTTLPAGLFDSLESLNLLDLSNNPWRCDCNMSWLYNWTQTQTQKSSLHLDMPNSTVCSEPSGRQGATLDSYLAQTYLACLAELSPGPTGGQPGTEGTPQSTIIAIIVACILVAILIIVAVGIAMYCRQRKYAFWAPPKSDKPDGREKSARDELKFKARHEIGSFYQDPKTGRVSAMWETDSIRGDFRHGTGMDPEDPETDSIKNRYVYENAALDVETEDPVVLVVDTNGTKVHEMPPPLASAYLNGHAKAESEDDDGRYSSNESVPSQINTASVPAHGYGDLDLEEQRVPQAVMVSENNLEHDAVRHEMDDVDLPNEPKVSESPDNPPDTPPGTPLGTPTANSISSMSDAEEETEEPPRHIADKAGELQVDLANKDIGETAEPNQELESNLAEEGEATGGGAHGLHFSVSSQYSQDYEHLTAAPGTPASPHDYETLHEAPVPKELTAASSSSTEAHGGTAATFVNEAFDVSDE